MNQREKDVAAANIRGVYVHAVHFADGAAYGRKDMLQLLISQCDEPATKLWLSYCLKELESE